MPFQSEKQRRYLHANHPEIAKRWEEEYATGGIANHFRKKFKKGSYSRSYNPGAGGVVQHGPIKTKTPTNNNGGGGNGPPSIVHAPKGPTAAELEAERQKKAAELQQKQQAEYRNFYNKFKGGIKKKSAYRDRLLAQDPLLETYKAKGLLDWNNIKSFDQDKTKTAEEIEKMKSSAWGYTRPWTSDESLYIADVDKFDPTWTPGWTGDSKTERLNKRIAETIGHEARHQVLGNVENRGGPWGWEGKTMWTGDPYSDKVETELIMDENSPYSKYMDEGGLKYQGYSTPMTSHELITRMGDFQSYNDPRIYDDIYGNIHGDMPRHLTSDVANKFYDAAGQFTKDASARTVGEKYEYIDPVMVEGLKRSYPDEDMVKALRHYSTRDVMDLLQEDYTYQQEKKEMMEDDTEAMSALTTPIEGLGGFNYVDTKTLLDAGYDPVEVGTWKNNEGLKLLKSLKNFKKGGVARKKYSTGGIANLFKFKNGGNATKKIKGQPHMLAYITPNEANKLVALGGQETMTDEGIPAYPEWDNYGQTKSEFEGSSPSSVGGGDQEDDVAKMEKDMGVTTDHSPHYTGSDAGWVVSEDEETEIGGADYIGPKDQVRIQKEIINRKNKFDSNWEKIKRAGSVMSSFMSITNPLGFAKFVYDQNKKKNERIAEIDADLALLDKIGATKFTPHTDTIYQTLEQEKLDLTQPRSNKDEDTGGDGPPTPLVVPEVMDEMADATGQIDMFDAWSNIKQKQALRAGLFADEDQAKVGEWVGDQRLFVNSGGLANLFRVKNQ